MELNLFRPKEKFLILEIAPHGARGTFLTVDDDRNIILERSSEKPLRDFIKSFIRKGKVPFRKGSRRVIAAVDPALATTIPIPLALARDEANTKTKVTLAELENLIAQAMAKIFNGCRSEAARRLVLGELDAVLVGATTADFKIDEKPVRSPVGFSGKKISLLLELVFTSRELFEELKPFFSEKHGHAAPFFFAEGPQAHLRAISHSESLPLNLITADGKGTSLYVFMKAEDEYPVLYREKLNWDFESLKEKLKEAFAVCDNAADELYCMFHRGAMSQPALRTFKKAIEPAFDGLLKELERAKVAGPVYIDAPHPLPIDLPYKHGAAVFSEHPGAGIVSGLGFSLPEMKDENEAASLRPLLYFLEAYFDASDSAINRKLRRRLHWLGEH